MELNYLDFILLAPLIYGFIKGLKKGLVFEAASVLGLILGIWGAVKFSGFTAEFLVRQFNWDFDQLPIVAFVVTFIVIVIAINFVAKIVDKLLDMIAIDFLNKLAGGIFGLLKIGLILGTIIYVLNLFNVQVIPEHVTEQSAVYQGIITFIDKLLPLINFDELQDQSQNIIKSV